MGMVGWIFLYYCVVPSFFIGCHSLCCRSDFLVLRGRFSLFAVGIPLFAGCIFLFAVFPFPFVPVFMPAVCCFAACMAFLPDVGVDFCLCVAADTQCFVKYFTFWAKKCPKYLELVERMRYLCTRFRKGAPRQGRKEGKGRGWKEGEGREAERERERGISLSFSSSEKSLKKYAERFGGNG